MDEPLFPNAPNLGKEFEVAKDGKEQTQQKGDAAPEREIVTKAGVEELKRETQKKPPLELTPPGQSDASAAYNQRLSKLNKMKERLGQNLDKARSNFNDNAKIKDTNER